MSDVFVHENRSNSGDAGRLVVLWQEELEEEELLQVWCL